ncbi:superoxide dismutase family protein [Nesterenkonia cremea]|uniref:Superoxide dismutase [Cu-Zn] n=1 Tax=Nesterenkonia cremea TaxID=1882340 RepID=A0A917EQ20_9MICC|nr:superoxide dismutase family protein [Nesterenkonia cremea]GGE64405.1 superoxide dismutase [Cu-Zn] [Nesterenkonia cremea]
MIHPSRGRTLLTGTAVLMLALAACGDDAETQQPTQDAAEQNDAETAGEQEDGGGSAAGPIIAEAQMTDAVGTEVGTLTISEAGEGVVEVHAEIVDMEPGFRGISIHETGVCEIQSANEYGQVGDFFSAGDHLAGDPEEDSGVAEGEEAPEELEEDPELPPDVEPEEQAEVYHPDHAGNLPNLLVTEERTGTLTVLSDRLDEDLLLDEDGSAVIVHTEADNAANIPERYAPEGPDYETLTTGDSGARAACGVLEAP